MGLIHGSGRFPGVENSYPLQYFLPRKYHRWRSLVGYSPWSCKELDMTEYTHKVKKKQNAFFNIHFTFVPNTALIKKKKKVNFFFFKFCLKMYGILLEVETEL